MPTNILDQFVVQPTTRVKFKCLNAESGLEQVIDIDFQNHFDERELEIINQYGHFHKINYEYKLYSGDWSIIHEVPIYSFVSTIVNKIQETQNIKYETMGPQETLYGICHVLAKLYARLSLHDIYLCYQGYIYCKDNYVTHDHIFVLPHDSNLCLNIHPNPAPDAERTTVNLNLYYHKDNTFYGLVNTSGTHDFIAEDEDYIMCNDTGNIYLNCSIAEHYGVEYRDCCDDWFSRGHTCCDEYAESGGEFDNCWKQTYSKDKQSMVNLYKTSGMNYTYGVEIETCSSRNVTYNSDLNLKAVYDGSVNGLEYVTGQLQGNMGIKMLKDITKHLTYCDAKIDRTCGLHIHIGGARFNRRFSIMLLKLCYAIEQDIYAILPESRKTNRFCKLLPGELIDTLNFHNYKKTLGKFIANQEINRDCNKSRVHPGGRYNSERYHWVNITNYSTRTGPETVEFRPHSGTMDFTKIYNWLLICMSIVKFTENKQRRIWNHGMSNVPITLYEVLKYSLNKDLFEEVYKYCKERATKFGQTLR